MCYPSARKNLSPICSERPLTIAPRMGCRTSGPPAISSPHPIPPAPPIFHSPLAILRLICYDNRFMTWLLSHPASRGSRVKMALLPFSPYPPLSLAMLALPKNFPILLPKLPKLLNYIHISHLHHITALHKLPRPSPKSPPNPFSPRKISTPFPDFTFATSHSL